MAELTIRPLSDLQELEACERLQAEVWEMEPIAIVPLHLLTTVQKNGGLVLGAFEGSDMVGFVLGLPGLILDGRGRLQQMKHCSHMAGVHPSQRNRGVGHLLKLAQREHVLTQGLRLITWTFDPLETRNAWLNFGKLGVIARRFLRNVYGQMHDELNRGLPSDRLEVEWWIATHRVRGRVDGVRPDPALAAEADSVTHVSAAPASGLLHLDDYELHLNAPRIQVEVPSAFQEIKRRDPGLARSWRYSVRDIFETYLGRGYLCTELLMLADRESGRTVYVLESAEAEVVLDTPAPRRAGD